MTREASRSVVRISLLFGLLVSWCPRAFALDPALTVSQYAHTAWRIRDGFAKGTIKSITQTPDGYLWLGTEFGLLRFDGVRAVAWQPPQGQPLPSSDIWSVLGGRDGTLWIGTSKGLASWKSGKLTQYPDLAGRIVMKILEDREGTVWASGTAVPAGTLCAIRSGSVRCFGQDGSLGYGVFALYEDGSGRLWAGVTEGFWRWQPGPPTFFRIPGDRSSVGGFSEDHDGALLITASSGVRRFVDGRAEPYHGLESEQLKTNLTLRDRDGGLWFGTSRSGLVHSYQGTTDAFGHADGLSGDTIGALFEDREGNVWVATSDGLDRFRGFAVSTLSAKQGIPIATSVLTSSDGTLWIGTPDGAKTWNRGQVADYRGYRERSVGALFQDDRGRIWMATFGAFGYLEKGRFVALHNVPARNVRAIAQDTEENLWIGDQIVGLLQLRPDGEVTQFPWRALGRMDFSLTLVADRAKGGVWIGFWDGGIVHFKDGAIRHAYGARDGLGEGHVNSFYADRDGALWVATEGGLSRLQNARVTTLTSRNGLPCDTVHWAVEDDTHALWLNMACGLVRVTRPEVDAWIAEPKRPITTTIFESLDGVRSQALASGYEPHVAKTFDGKLWFLSNDGVSVVDPLHLPFNTLPPPVHVELVTADRTTYEVTSTADEGLRLPALTRDLQIDYTALSLVAPEKNRFRYKLEGYDSDWRDVGTRRQAFYNDLPPRDYRFRVVASNNSGVWNESGAALEFSIAPAYYQRTPFRVTVVAGVLVLLWSFYQIRLRQLAYEYDARLQERVNERMRIARDLHDTLLQGFHGLLFRFQAATNILPDRPAEAKRNFETAIDLAAQTLTEGRDAVQNLRSPTIFTKDLAEAISTLGEELAAAAFYDDHDPNIRPPVIDVAVEGTPRNLHPILRDDIYRNAGEALRNAFRHARARRIEVEICYDDRQFRLRVRDDGKGLDPSVAAEPRPGHFGLPGMRERADLVGGHLDVWSEVGLGTEVDLKIPAVAAYATPRARGRFWVPFVKGKTGTES